MLTQTEALNDYLNHMSSSSHTATDQNKSKFWFGLCDVAISDDSLLENVIRKKDDVESIFTIIRYFPDALSKDNAYLFGPFVPLSKQDIFDATNFLSGVKNKSEKNRYFLQNGLDLTYTSQSNQLNVYSPHSENKLDHIVNAVDIALNLEICSALKKTFRNYSKN